MAFKKIHGSVSNKYKTVCDKKSDEIRQFSFPQYMAFKKIHGWMRNKYETVCDKKCDEIRQFSFP